MQTGSTPTHFSRHGIYLTTRSRQRIMMTRYYELTARPNSNRLPSDGLADERTVSYHVMEWETAKGRVHL